MKTARWMCLCAAAAWLVAGCAQPPSSTTKPALLVASSDSQSAAPLDAVPATPAMFSVELFVISVPRGTYSNNDAFWKRIDEECVNVATHDLLYKNGIRVGIAPMSELEHFAKFMEQSVPVQKFGLAGPDVRNAQVEMKASLPEQTIFHYDRTNTLIGRSYDRSENIINVSFEPAARKPGHVRLTLCPMVRATRKRLQFTPLNDSFELMFVSPEMYYDLNFKLDIPGDSFAIVTPSPDAAKPSIIGHAFLTKDSPTQEEEQILLIVPRTRGSEKTGK